VEVELQEKITAAALRLTQDRSRSRSIRKKRIQSFHKANDKVIHQALFYKLCCCQNVIVQQKTKISET